MNSRGNRHRVERGKSILILLLTVSAVLLICRFGMYQDFNLSDKQREPLGSNLGGMSNSNSEGVLTLRPVRMVLQGSEGRYGVQYSQPAIGALFEADFGNLLREALDVAGVAESITETQWRESINQAGIWIYYDFIYPLPLGEISVWLKNSERQPDLNWNVRRFLLTEFEGQKSLLCLDEDSGQYYRFSLPDNAGVSWDYLVNAYEPNGATFAFEEPENFSALAPYTLILEKPAQKVSYSVTNPLADLTEEDTDELLRALSFNPKVVSQISVADGQRFQDGLDSIGLTEGGTITFHSRQGGSNRYQVEEMTSGSLVERCRELLYHVLEQRMDAGTYHLRSIALEDDGGRAEVLFEYRLDGTPVQVSRDGWAARFVFAEGELLDFTIHVRQYTKTETPSPVLPEIQAAAAMKSLLQEGKELLLCYIDWGDTTQVMTRWTAY